MKLTLALGFTDSSDESASIQLITKEVDWPAVPREGDQIQVEGEGYDVLKVTHDFDKNQILVRCLPWGATYQTQSEAGT